MERYEDSYRLCYVRGPEGIIVELWAGVMQRAVRQVAGLVSHCVVAQVESGTVVSV